MTDSVTWLGKDRFLLTGVFFKPSFSSELLIFNESENKLVSVGFANSTRYSWFSLGVFGDDLFLSGTPITNNGGIGPSVLYELSLSNLTVIRDIGKFLPRASEFFAASSFNGTTLVLGGETFRENSSILLYGLYHVDSNYFAKLSTVVQSKPGYYNLIDSIIKVTGTWYLGGGEYYSNQLTFTLYSIFPTLLALHSFGTIINLSSPLLGHGIVKWLFSMANTKVGINTDIFNSTINEFEYNGLYTYNPADFTIKNHTILLGNFQVFDLATQGGFTYMAGFQTSGGGALAASAFFRTHHKLPRIFSCKNLWTGEKRFFPFDTSLSKMRTHCH